MSWSYRGGGGVIVEWIYGSMKVGRCLRVGELDIYLREWMRLGKWTKFDDTILSRK